MDEVNSTVNSTEAIQSDSPLNTTEVAPKPKKKMSRAERKKLRVINRLINGEINGTKAADMLGITTRQVRNLKRQVLEQGDEGVIHKNKYYKPYNAIEQETSEFIVKLYRKQYRGTNFSEFARIVQTEYNIDASRSTIYNFLRRARIRSPQRKKKKTKKTVVTTSTSKTPVKSSTKKVSKAKEN